MPYKDIELRRIKARAYTAAYRARKVKNIESLPSRNCLFCDADIRALRSDAKFCCRDHKKKHFDMNRDYKEYYWANRNARRKSALNSYHSNLDKSRQKQRDRQKTNPALFAAHTAKRRAAILCRTPKWLSKTDFANIRKFYSLADELSKAYGFKWHVDHIIPLQGKYVSGLHVIDNLQVIPANMNLSKNNRFEVA